MDERNIGSESVEVVLLPKLGGRIHALRVFGRHVLRTPADSAAYLREPFAWGSYVMAPWCNRLSTEQVMVGGREVRLEPTFPDGTAIHGQVLHLPWDELGPGVFRVAGGGNGWPWDYEVEQVVSVEAATLTITLTLWNRSTSLMPAGIGIHPWFRCPLLVAIRAEAELGPNSASRQRPEPVSGALDRRTLGEMPDGLDHAWTDLSDPPVELAWPGLGIRASIDVTAPARWIVAASPPDLNAVAVEAQTHAPQGLRRLMAGEPGAMAWLEPGGALTLSVVLTFRPAAF